MTRSATPRAAVPRSISVGRVPARVRTWTPEAGPFLGFLVTHNESISIADYLTLRDGDAVLYRPTVHYAYHPCDDAVLSMHEMPGRAGGRRSASGCMMEEITGGMDELGVLLMGHERGAFWYGSQLTIEQARELAPFNSATSLQVAAGALGGMVWAVEHPTPAWSMPTRSTTAGCSKSRDPILAR